MTECLDPVPMTRRAPARSAVVTMMVMAGLGAAVIGVLSRPHPDRPETWRTPSSRSPRTPVRTMGGGAIVPAADRHPERVSLRERLCD